MDNPDKAYFLSEILQLQQQLAQVNHEKDDLEIILETITEHSTTLENQIYQQNRQMREYIEQVNKLTDAAAVLENDQDLDPSLLQTVTQRLDELGQLARVFLQMANQVKTREQRLKQQVQALRIEIDQTRKQQQVAEIVEADSFQTLKQKLQRMKQVRQVRQPS
jgi:DNA repair ATPase RecN